ncbi:hypothetical protein [uncultured Winogradskyella sp.]|uniref:hypothetical protein n=1 Tax=uncultured Winogradskyella sp. TaxID=395353 RepID=UPI0030DB3DE3
MNKNSINILYKWWLRVLYARILVIGIGVLCFALVLIITDYKASSKPEFNTFITIICTLLGVIICAIGLFYKTETEHKIGKKLHEKDLE